MSDSWDRAGGPPIDADAFQEWVTHTAESRGVDERELINQLVSAYWILDEMNDVSGDGDDPPIMDPGRDDRADAGAGVDRPGVDRPGVDGSGVDGSGVDGSGVDGSGVDDSGNVGDTGGDTARTGGEHDASEGSSAGVDDGDQSGAVDDISREINALRTSMQRELEVSQAVTELRREVSDLSLEVETQRSRREEFSDRITDELTRLHGRVESIDADGDTDLRDRVDAVEDELERIEERIAGVDATVDEVQTDQQELDAWIDDEFDDIESLFRDLIDRSDTHTARVDDVDDRLADLNEQLTETEADLQPAVEAAADREAIADLRREALDAGVNAAACARCGSTVDLSMLDEPACPDCEATFHGVDADTPLWNPFASPTLTTAPSRFDDE